jgi:hypothetical protein
MFGPKKVLIIDDDADYRKVIGEVLHIGRDGPCWRPATGRPDWRSSAGSVPDVVLCAIC